MSEIEEISSSKAREEIVQLKRRIEQIEQHLQKSLTVGYILLFIFGQLGFHRFYCGLTESGVTQLCIGVAGWVALWFFSFLSGAIIFAILGLWLLIDIFLMPRMIRKANSKITQQSNERERIC